MQHQSYYWFFFIIIKCTTLVTTVVFMTIKSVKSFCLCFPYTVLKQRSVSPTHSALACPIPKRVLVSPTSLIYYPKYKCKPPKSYCHVKCMIQYAVSHSYCQNSYPTWSSCKKDLLFSQLFNIRWMPICTRLGALVFVSLTTKRANTLAKCPLIRLEIVVLWNLSWWYDSRPSFWITILIFVMERL